MNKHCFLQDASHCLGHQKSVDLNVTDVSYHSVTAHEERGSDPQFKAYNYDRFNPILALFNHIVMVHTLFAPILNTRNHALVWDLHMFVMFGTYTGVFFNGWDWLRSGLQVSLAVSDANMELPWDLLEESAGYLGKIAHVTARWGSKLGTWGKLYDLLIINHGNHGFPVDLTSGLIEIHFFFQRFHFSFFQWI